MKNVLPFVSILVATLMFPLNAYAYLDPGTGSALIQGVIGAVAAIGLVLKLYWHRLLRVLGLIKTPLTENKQDVSNAEDQETSDK